MKKKIIIYALLLIIFVSCFPQSLTHAADKKSVSIAIPISMGLTGTDNSAKTFSLDLPSGVTPAAIVTSTLKYNGSNSTVEDPSVVNGKIKLILKGNQSSKTIEVQGYRASYEGLYIANIYNSIWLYSDGRRWQINEYDEEHDVNNAHRNVFATDGIPSQNPPTTVVSAGPLQDNQYLKWYHNSNTEVIDSTDVIQSTITPILNRYSSYVTQPPKFKNNRVILNYTIPNSIPYTNESTAGLSGVAEGRRYYASVSYHYEATAKVTSYSYGGTVTFDYKLPTEPNLTGEVSLIAPNPNPAQATGKDIPVKISIKGLLGAYTNTSNIQEWVFYAKETGNDSSLKTKKDQLKVLTSTQTFDFYITKEKAIAPRFTQNYTLTVTVRFAQPVYTDDGEVTSLSETFTINASTYTGPEQTPPPPPTSGPELSPPQARITAPTKVKAGQSFIVSGANSFDKDGTIVSYAWQQPNADLALYGKSSDTSYPFSAIGTTQTITLTVTDNSGLTGTTSHDVEVVAPVPEPYLVIGGTLKENRKITLHNGTRARPDDLPLVPEKTKFRIELVEGNGSSTDIKYNGNLVGTDDVDFLVKSPGKYQVSLYVENIAGYGATATKTLIVSPDEVPIPYISIPSGAYRDPSDGNRAKVVLDDLSISPDFDYLAHRLWTYRYDSDNDSNFSEESWVVISDANLDRATVYLPEVGRYEFRLTLTEEFGQPTIDAFVTAADRRSANTDTQATIEKIVTVYNRKPVSDWTW